MRSGIDVPFRCVDQLIINGEGDTFIQLNVFRVQVAYADLQQHFGCRHSGHFHLKSQDFRFCRIDCGQADGACTIALVRGDLHIRVFGEKYGRIQAHAIIEHGGLEAAFVDLHELRPRNRDFTLRRKDPLGEGACLEAFRVGHVSHEILGPLVRQVDIGLQLTCIGMGRLRWQHTGAFGVSRRKWRTSTVERGSR